MRLVHETTAGRVLLGDSVAEGLPCEVDHIITDPPYSERTVAGHNKAAKDIENAHVKDSPCFRGERHELAYAFWTPDDVRRAIETWAKKCSGWMAVFTDHVLGPVFEASMADIGRYTFAPVPAITPGGRFRMMGDGPACCTDWLIVSRPRSRGFFAWGNPQPFYLASKEFRKLVIGGKPVGLMRAVVADYSRPGDLVCDPCAGGGTTGVACEDLGRRYLLIERDEGRANMCAQRLGASSNAGLPLFDRAAGQT